jgi:hypothetical protein
VKILFLTSRFPYPLEKGDKLRAYHFIKGLSKNHEVHLASVSDATVKEKDFAEVSKLCKSVKVFRINLFGIGFNISKSFFSNVPLQSAYFYDADIKNKILKYGNEISPDVIVCMLTRMSRYAEAFTGVPKLLDYQDAFSKGVERRLAHEGFSFVRC